MTTLPPWWLVITMPPPHHLVNIVPFSSWRTGDARFPLQRWPSKEEAASEPPVTFLYLVLSLSRILSSSFISYIYSHLSLSCSYSFSIASSSSISFLLSRSLCSPPPTSDPPSLPQPPRPSPRHSNNATQPRPPSYLLHLLLLLPPLPSPSLCPSSPSPRKRGIASNSNYWTRGYHASNLTLRHDVDTTLYHFLRGTENTVDDVKIRQLSQYRSWLSFPKNSLIERDDGTWYEKSMTLFCPNFQDR